MSEVIATPPAREFWAVTAQLRALRARLVTNIQQREEAETTAALERRGAVQQMAETVEREANAAVEQVAERTSAMSREAEGMAGAV